MSVVYYSQTALSPTTGLLHIYIREQLSLVPRPPGYEVRSSYLQLNITTA